jgi:hypothetical protein
MSKHPIPDAALASHIAILGKTGSGKTYAAKGVVESVLSEGGRVCVIDPTGAWHGLRSSASGKSAGFPVVIFGGAHADMPLSGAHGEALAEIIGTASTPAILDTSLMKVGERTRFFADFADALVRKNKGPLHLVIDEAHLFAPQGKVNDPQSGAMLHAANNLVSLGRSRGLRVILITQRPAKLHKDSLTQVETMVALRLIAPQDRRAVEDWIKDNADEKQGREIIASLATLKTGQGWVWAPELGVLERVTFPKIRTFDTSRAPDEADGGAGPVLAPIDREAIEKRLQTVAADALANDPRNLKAEVAKLKRELAAKSAPAPDPVTVQDAERRGYGSGYARGKIDGRADALAGLNAKVTAVAAALDGIGGQFQSVRAAAAEFKAWAEDAVKNPPRVSAVPPSHPPVTRPAPMMRPRMPAPAAHGDKPIGAERRPLAVLASVHPAGMTEAQWAVAASLKRKGGTWSTYISRLRTADRVVKRGDLWYATDQGLLDLGEYAVDMPPPGPQLVAFWAEKLPGAAPMLRKLGEHYPHWISRDHLAAELGITATGGTFNTYLSRLRSPGLIEEDGDKNVRAAAILMESAA